MRYLRRDRVLTPRLLLDRQQHAARAVDPGGELVVLHAVIDMADVAKPHRRAVLVADDQALERLGSLELAVDHDVVGAVAAVQRTSRQIDVAVADRGLHLVDAETARGHRAGIKIDAHGILGRTVDVDERDAVDHRQPLCEERFAVLVDLR